MTGTAMHATWRPARSVAADGCPNSPRLASAAERLGMPRYAKPLRLGGRLRVPR